MQCRAGLGGAPLPWTRTTRRTVPLPGITLLWAALLALGLRGAPASSQLTDEDQVALLVTHNSCRGRVQPSAVYMLPMRWDENLRVLAQSYAVKCIWDHNPELEDVGENLYATTGGLDVHKAVDSWFDEHQDYNYQNNSCQEDKMCGHYTQVVWADSTAVGCAVHRCDTLEGLDGFEKALIMVCNYSPAGNYEGRQPYEEGESCSQCPEDHQRCQDNLCMPDLEPSEEPDTEEKDKQTSTPLPGTAGPSIPPDTSLSSTSGPPIPPDTQEPGLDESPPPPAILEPTERDEMISMSGSASSTPPALLLTSLLVLLSLGV